MEFESAVDIRNEILRVGGQPVADFFCPVEFWPALGYDGGARFVGIYWEPGGDEACWNDGRMGLVGANWPAYELLIEHNFRWNEDDGLGSSEDSARFWLVIDRRAERENAWRVPAEVAYDVLRRQWVLADVEDVAADWRPIVVDLEVLVAEIRAQPMPTTEEVEQQMERSYRCFEALMVVLGRDKVARA